MTWFRVGGAGIPASLKSAMNSVLNKKFGTSGHTYPPSDWPSDVNLLGPLPEKTASGAIASFSDGADTVPLKSLVFGIEPVQASGTPSPSNPLPISGHVEMNGVHCGKNLIGQYALITTNNIAWGCSNMQQPADGSFILNAGTYTFSCSRSFNGLYVADENGAIFTKYNSDFLTFTLTKKTPIKLMAYTNTADDLTQYTYQLEVGSSASSYEPFSSETKKWDWSDL